MVVEVISISSIGSQPDQSESRESSITQSTPRLSVNVARCGSFLTLKPDFPRLWMRFLVRLVALPSALSVMVSPMFIVLSFLHL